MLTDAGAARHHGKSDSSAIRTIAESVFMLNKPQIKAQNGCSRPLVAARRSACPHERAKLIWEQPQLRKEQCDETVEGRSGGGDCPPSGQRVLCPLCCQLNILSAPLSSMLQPPPSPSRCWFLRLAPAAAGLKLSSSSSRRSRRWGLVHSCCSRQAVATLVPGTMGDTASSADRSVTQCKRSPL